ncbi:glutamyl-tRNA reductase [Ornithobacterium rhinotracheale]|uniref:glutamyl-tRNA reductase n=1 Tax=Ornithobacterium rhinotracheale TaxID=28251 RepID=UPI00129D0411|nr:glutamyl-tRNA reductase [Ornithobacterium rhinotracheale]MRJ10328.1 glutamyl-tRNA reductase [Ornithobacterium rhinotracheale]
MSVLEEKETLEQFHVIGISYEKADVRTRGEYAFFEDWEKDFVLKAKNIGLEHFFILSTCNRTEIYFFAPSHEPMMQLYCEQVGGDLSVFEEITFIKKGKQALNHLFRVSSGLESQILGDFEILGQMRKAFKRFKKLGCSNAYLERFINTAVQISKQIKNETSLSDGATSVSYAAVQYILNQIPNLEQKNVVLFGTGKIGRNTCENLVKHTGNNKVTLINRTLAKAEKLSQKLDIKFRKVEELTETLQNTDVLIVATGAKTPTITQDMLPDRQMLIIDMSIPANVAPEVKALSNIELINVDMLSQTINETLKARESEVPKVETIIRLNLWEFEDWIEGRQFVPAIEAFKERMLFLARYEKKQLRKKEEISICPKGDRLSLRLAQKMTNQFAAYLMEHPDKAHQTIGFINEIFHLDLKEED